MSKYKKIETKITCPDTLRQALQEVIKWEGLKFEEGDLVAHGYRRSQSMSAQFVIRKAELHAYGDLGFALTHDGTFEIIVDDLDQRGQKVASEVKRSYSILEATAQAQARGYTVSPKKDEWGRTLELQLRRY